MKWFKSLWLKLRKSNNLPGNEVLIPIKEVSLNGLPEGTIVTVKPKRKPRKKKETLNVTN